MAKPPVMTHDQSYEEWICARIAPVARRAAVLGLATLLGTFCLDLALHGLGPKPLLSSSMRLGAVLALLGAGLSLRSEPLSPRALDLSLALALGSQALLAALHILLAPERIKYLPFIVLFYILSAILIAPAISLRSYAASSAFNIAYLAILLALSHQPLEAWLDLVIIILMALGFLGQAVVSQNREARQHWRLVQESAYHASIDGLSGLLNRRAFVEKAGQALGGHRQRDAHGGMSSFLMLDIDHFKAVNDTWGHECGDMVIRSIARAVKESVRDDDLVGRLGGEEFGVLLPSLDLENSSLIAERIRTTIEGLRLDYRGEEICVTVSLGLCHDASGGLEAMMREADLCLYEAKRGGRNRLISRTASC